MKRILTAIGLSLLLAFPVYSVAQDQSKKQTQSQQMDKQGKIAVVGEVDDIRQIQLSGVETKHTLLKLKSKQGKKIVVNIGDATKTPDVMPKKGDRIIALGKSARIGGKPVVFAKYIGKLRPVGHVGQNKGQGGRN